MSVKCKHCGKILSESHTGACPSCGQTGKIISVHIHEGMKLSDTVQYTSIREYYEKNTVMLAVVIGITVISSFLGLFIAGIAGVFVGLVLGGLSFLLGPKAETKVREITHGQ